MESSHEGEASPSIFTLQVNTPRFDLGALVATPRALRNLTEADIKHALERHLSADWGELDEEDKRANDQALAHGARLLSSYRSSTGIKFWVITEADRSSTCVLLPADY